MKSNLLLSFTHHRRFSESIRSPASKLKDFNIYIVKKLMHFDRSNYFNSPCVSIIFSGIPPHVDTHSAFEDTILSLSLGAQVRSHSIILRFKYLHNLQLTWSRGTLTTDLWAAGTNVHSSIIKMKVTHLKIKSIGLKKAALIF